MKIRNQKTGGMVVRCFSGGALMLRCTGAHTASDTETRLKICDQRWDSTRFLFFLWFLFVLSIKPRQQKFSKERCSDYGLESKSQNMLT